MSPLGFSLIEDFNNPPDTQSYRDVDVNPKKDNKKYKLKLKKKDSERRKKTNPQNISSNEFENVKEKERRKYKEPQNQNHNFQYLNDQQDSIQENHVTDKYVEDITRSLTSQSTNKRSASQEIEESEDDDIDADYFEEENDNIVEMYDNLNPPLHLQGQRQQLKEHTYNNNTLSSNSKTSPSTINDFDEDNYKSIPRNYQSNDEILYDLKQGIQGHVSSHGLKERSNGQNNDLLNKLNQLIILLEEQQEQKTGHVMEELIMYCFLGVFMIYLVDSFVRVGKYSR